MSWFEDGTVQIYYEVAGGEEAGSGETVLLLPGLFGAVEEFSPLQEALVAAGYRTIIADLPGSGRSKPQPRLYTATYLKDDACSFIALLEHLASGPTHLLGFSDGGEISLLIAATRPELARSLVVWGAAGQIHDPTGNLRAAMANLIDDPIPSMQGFRQYLVSAYGESNARAMTQSVFSALNDIVAAGGDISLSKVGDISAPVLLIGGEHDPFAPPALIIATAARIRSAQTLTVKNAGHNLYMTDGELLTQTILDWLAKH